MNRRAAVALASCLAGVLGVSGCSATQPRSIAVALTSPPMGWNSWNSGIELSETSVKQTIDAMISSGMRDAGYLYVNLDAGWAAPQRNSEGRLTADPERFPHGIKPLADYAHAHGLRFGLYSSPFNQTCGQDPRIASVGHETTDAATFAAWGVDYVKYDWCRQDADHDEQVRVFRSMGNALRQTGRPIVYSINPNSSPDTHAGSDHDWFGIADIVRTSGDLVPVWRNTIPSLGPADPFTTGMFTGVPDQFDDASRALDRPQYLDMDMLVVGVTWDEFFLNHRGGFQDSDKLASLPSDVRAQLQAMRDMPDELVQQIAHGQPSLTTDEQRSHFSLWAMMGAPLIAGNDLRSMTDETKSILTNREVIAVDQDTTAARAHRIDPGGRVWVKPMSNGSVAVALFNNSDQSATVSTERSAVGLPSAQCYTVRDLWTHQTETSAGELTAQSLAPHAIRLLRVSPGCAT